MIVWSNMEVLAKKHLSSLIYNSEYNFDSQVIKIADKIYAEKSVKMILIAGPSASGKTTFANLLADRLEFRGVKVHRISTDDFFIDRDKIEVLPSGLLDMDSLNAMDVKLLTFTIESILEGHRVVVPRFDFVEGRRAGDTREILAEDADVTIVEGIHALNPLILGKYGIHDDRVVGIYISPRRDFLLPSGRTIAPVELRLLRRILRDHYSRGHSLADTLAQWDEVLKAERVNIYPFVHRASFTVDSVYDYELLVYKRCLGNSLDAYPHKWTDNIREVLREVADIPDMTIPSTSLLNEFIQGGVID
ncbi:MAG: hypothetical protein IK037_00990 [Clostridia bacterium]|nr:hypothetical protein [Clostridia bacterium]MBR5987119.1 hypothetical protein [Clostridia bacterium]